jgi:hypothetical protein
MRASFRKELSQMFENVRAGFNRVHHKLGSSPLILWFEGALVLLLWASATVVQIQTSEYLALGNSTRVAGVAWGVLMQPVLLVTGQAPIQYATAWVYGWVVEVTTLVFATALAVSIRKIATVNPHLAKWYVVGGALLIILNSYADYSSSPGANWLVQGLIALAVGGMVVVGLPLGIGLIEHGFEEL